MKLHKIIPALVIDYGHMVKGALAPYFFKKAPKHYLGHIVDGKIPIVIVPGLLGQWTFLKKVADTLSLLGHPTYIIPELKYNIFTIPDSAVILKNIIERENLKNVIIVSHSKGGLIGKSFMIHHNKDKRVIGMISLATPYSGSAMANLVPYDPIRELRHDNGIIKDLQAHAVVNKDIVSICPIFDNHVWAEAGSKLEGAKNIHVDVMGHHKITNDNGVIEIIKQEVERISQEKAVV